MRTLPADSQATARPWTYDETWALITGPKGEEVSAIHSGIADGTQRLNRNTAAANAELIIAAVNERWALLEVERISRLFVEPCTASEVCSRERELSEALSVLAKSRQ